MCTHPHHSIPDILCSSLPTGHGMSTGATGVTSSPHHQSSTVTAPVNTQQQLPAAGRGMCLQCTSLSFLLFARVFVKWLVSLIIVKLLNYQNIM